MRLEKIVTLLRAKGAKCHLTPLGKSFVLKGQTSKGLDFYKVYNTEGELQSWFHHNLASNSATKEVFGLYNFKNPQPTIWINGKEKTFRNVVPTPKVQTSTPQVNRAIPTSTPNTDGGFASFFFQNAMKQRQAAQVTEKVVRPQPTPDVGKSMFGNLQSILGKPAAKAEQTAVRSAETTAKVQPGKSSPFDFGKSGASQAERKTASTMGREYKEPKMETPKPVEPKSSSVSDYLNDLDDLNDPCNLMNKYNPRSPYYEDPYSSVLEDAYSSVLKDPFSDPFSW